MTPELDSLFSIAATGAVQAVKAMLPLGILAVLSLVLEILLNQFDRTFSACWWFFFAFILLLLGEVTWSSWTASTPMADIIRFGENAGSLIVSVFAFLAIVGLLLLYLMVLGVRRIVIEAHGSGWGWALLRLAPLIPLIGFICHVLVNGNAMVGETGFLNLINR